MTVLLSAATPVRSSNAVVQLVAGTTEQSCEATLRCEWNVTAAVDSPSGLWSDDDQFDGEASFVYRIDTTLGTVS